MPRKPVIDYKRYYVFKNGYAYCTVPGCARPDWGYSLTGSNTKSMLKHMRDKHPAEYEEGVELQAAALAHASIESVGELGVADAETQSGPVVAAYAEVPALEEAHFVSPPVSFSPPRKFPRRRNNIEESAADVSSTDEPPGAPSKPSPYDGLYKAAMKFFMSEDKGPKPDPSIFEGLPGMEHPKFFEMLFTNELRAKLQNLSDVNVGTVVKDPDVDVQTGPPVEVLAVDEQGCLTSEKLSSMDESHAAGVPEPVHIIGTGLSEMDFTEFYADHVAKKLKRTLEKLCVDPAHATRKLPDRPGRKFGMALARVGSLLDDGVPCPVVDVGDGTVMYVGASVACTHYDGEGESSSDGEEGPTTSNGQPMQKHYIVQKVLDKRVHDGELQLLTKWKGYRRAEWQPYKNFDKANEALMAYELKNASTAAESTDDEEAS